MAQSPERVCRGSVSPKDVPMAWRSTRWPTGPLMILAREFRHPLEQWPCSPTPALLWAQCQLGTGRESAVLLTLPSCAARDPAQLV